jgi:hypothetical protein
MTDVNINGLGGPLAAPAADDLVPVWDTSAGQTLKIRRDVFVGAAITGGGTLALGGFTLTVPATGTAVLAAGTTAVSIKPVDAGVGTITEVLKLGRTGAAPSTSQRGVGLVFEDADNASHIAAVVAMRPDSTVDYKGGLAFFLNGAAASTQIGAMTQRLAISSAGIITISGYGAGTLATNASGVIAASDGRYKAKTRGVVDALATVLRLTPTYYRWREDSPFASEYEELGFVAQEVAAVIPAASPEPESEDRYKNYADRAIIAMLVGAVQELTARLAVLEAGAGA